MPLETVVVDERPEWANSEGLPADVRAICASPLEYAKNRVWGPEDAVCVFTHSHELDLELVSFFLPWPLGYLGLIGSEHKARVFRARLRERTPEQSEDAFDELWEKLHCPIGVPLESGFRSAELQPFPRPPASRVPGLGHKNPKVIAVSIAAELLKDWALCSQQDLAPAG
jgi:xanthine/CO dehydrogenase XdhC/CoxF family maturation factor